MLFNFREKKENIQTRTEAESRTAYNQLLILFHDAKVFSTQTILDEMGFDTEEELESFADKIRITQWQN